MLPFSPLTNMVIYKIRRHYEGRVSPTGPWTFRTQCPYMRDEDGVITRVPMAFFPQTVVFLFPVPLVRRGREPFKPFGNPSHDKVVMIPDTSDARE